METTLQTTAQVSNLARFQAELTSQYKWLFTTQPDYSFAASRTTPEALAEKMTNGLLSGSASKDGDGIRRTCKVLGVAYTYGAINAFIK